MEDKLQQMFNLCFIHLGQTSIWVSIYLYIYIDIYISLITVMLWLGFEIVGVRKGYFRGMDLYPSTASVESIRHVSRSWNPLSLNNTQTKSSEAHQHVVSHNYINVLPKSRFKLVPLWISAYSTTNHCVQPQEMFSFMSLGYNLPQ